MNVRLGSIWEALRASYWFVPGCVAVGALGLAEGALVVDRALAASSADLPEWIYSGGSENARTVLSTIAGAMMSVTSVVFSITIVALTLAANQFGPRLLRNFMKDWGSQLTLAVFIGTFVYALLMLRTIRDAGDGFVPNLGVSVAIMLTLFSTGVLIFFVHHISTMIQAEEVVAAVDEELRCTIERLYPDELAENRRGSEKLPADFELNSAEIRAEQGNYVQGIDTDGLLRLAGECDVTMRILQRPGDFVPDGGRILQVGPADRVDADLTQRIRDAVVWGKRRTPTQDVEYCILQLVEVAVRSLSPGINDPFTAVACVDRLGSALRRLAGKPYPGPEIFDDEGRLRILMAETDFAGHAAAAFNQIRQNARGSVAVLIRLLEVLASIAETLDESAEREGVAAALKSHADMICDAARREVTESHDVRDVEMRHAKVITRLQRCSSS